MRLLKEIRNYVDNYHVKSGVYHYYRNEFNQAVSFLQRALRDEGDLSDSDRRNARSYLALSLTGLAEGLAAKGDLDEGVRVLREATAVQPGYPDVHFRLAQLLEGLGRNDEAVAAYEEAIGRHPAYLEAHVSLGLCRIRTGDREAAGRAFERALRLKLRLVQEPYDRGRECLEQERLEEADAQMREAFLSVPELAQECLGEALDRMRAEEFDRALTALDRALRYKPEYPDLHNFRGIALCELERPEEGADAFRRSAELAPEHVVPRLNLAFALAGAGDHDGARAALESLLQLDPAHPVAVAKLAELAELRSAERGGAAAQSRGTSR